MEPDNTPTDGLAPQGAKVAEGTTDGTSTNDANGVQVDESPTGMGSEAAEGINDAGIHVQGERSALDSRASGRSFRAGAERSGSEPLVNRGWVHESGYGGKGGGPRVSSDQRENSERGGSQTSAEETKTALSGAVVRGSGSDAEETLVHHLKRDEQVMDPALLVGRPRAARALVTEGSLRLTLMAIAAGGHLTTHSTNGPVTIHVIEGDVLFEALDRKYQLSTGDVLVLAASVEHSASSAAGCVFLLTAVSAPAVGSRPASE